MISTTTSVICIVDIQLFMEKECSICRKKYTTIVQYQRKRNNNLRNWNFDEKSFHSRQQKTGIIFLKYKICNFSWKNKWKNKRFLEKFSTSYRKSLYLTPFFPLAFRPLSRSFNRIMRRNNHLEQFTVCLFRFKDTNTWNRKKLHFLDAICLLLYQEYLQFLHFEAS